MMTNNMPHTFDNTSDDSSKSENILIKARLYPLSKTEEIIRDGDMIHFHIREPAEDNRANQRMMEVLNDLYPNCFIRIIKGHHSPSKIISIEKRKI